MEFESLNNLITAPLGRGYVVFAHNTNTRKDLIFMQGSIKKTVIDITNMHVLQNPSFEHLAKHSEIPRMSDVQENGAFVTGRLNKLMVKPFHALQYTHTLNT